MLRKEAVEAGTLDLIKKMMADNRFQDFNLVGGTALALMIGHRKSIDIDLFSTKDFNSLEIAEYLTSTYNAISIQSIKNGVFCFVNNIKIDVLSHQYPLVGDVVTDESIRMISLQDIAAMKLNAIYDNGTRPKDFVDIFALLENFTLDQMLQACHQKYPDINIPVAKNALVYFEDVQLLTPVDFIGPDVKWSDITERLKNAHANPHLSFGLSETTKKVMKKTQSHEKKKNGGRKL
jgi:hypothetical protein